MDVRVNFGNSRSNRYSSRSLSDIGRTLYGVCLTRCPPIGGAAKRRATKIRPKAVGSGIFGGFSNFEKCRSEAGDVISGVAVD